MAVTTKAKASSKAVGGGTRPHVVSRIDALLRVMRVIAQHEERLCTILHEVQRSGKVGTTVAGELKELLEEMPSSEYQDDLLAARESVGRVAGGAGTTKVQGKLPGVRRQSTKRRTPR